MAAGVYDPTGQWISGYENADWQINDYAGRFATMPSTTETSEAELKQRVQANLAKAQLRAAFKQVAVEVDPPVATTSANLEVTSLPDDVCWDWFKGTCIRGKFCLWKHGEETDEDLKLRVGPKALVAQAKSKSRWTCPICGGGHNARDCPEKGKETLLNPSKEAVTKGHRPKHFTDAKGSGKSGKDNYAEAKGQGQKGKDSSFWQEGQGTDKMQAPPGFTNCYSSSWQEGQETGKKGKDNFAEAKGKGEKFKESSKVESAPSDAAPALLTPVRKPLERYTFRPEAEEFTPLTPVIKPSEQHTLRHEAEEFYPTRSLEQPTLRHEAEEFIPSGITQGTLRHEAEEFYPSTGEGISPSTPVSKSSADWNWTGNWMSDKFNCESEEKQYVRPKVDKDKLLDVVQRMSLHNEKVLADTKVVELS